MERYPGTAVTARLPRWGYLLGIGALGYAAWRRPAVGLPLAAAGLLLYRNYRPKPQTRRRMRPPLAATTAITIARPARELFDYWRDFTRLPLFMRHLERVEQIDANRWRWSARIPALDRTLTWESQVIEERDGELLRWRSLPGSGVENEGEIRFLPAPGGRGTELHLRMSYSAGGSLANAAAGLLDSVTEQVIKEELRRFKELMETGEIPTIEGQPTG